jgi:hypothetical protein
MGHYRSYCTNQERTYYLSEFIIELQFLISYFLIRYEDEPPVDDTEVFMHRYFRILLLLFTGAMIDYCCLSYYDINFIVHTKFDHLKINSYTKNISGKNTYHSIEISALSLPSSHSSSSPLLSIFIVL